MAKKFRIEVEKVNGYCACGYKVGDVITCVGLKTPDRPFCGGAYSVLFPVQNALHSGAVFKFERNPHSISKLSCPDNGNVIFKITLVE